MAIRILFVDDEPNVLDGLRRMLRPMRGQWDLAFAGGGDEALALMASHPADIVVSDMRMPRMDGAQLLTEISRQWPRSVRIILSGHSEQEMILKAIGPTHQYLNKPCEADTLKATIERAAALSSLLTSPRIQSAVSRMQAVPCMPSLLTELIDALQNPACSLETAGDIIARDVGMTAQILRLVNSAYFGLRREIASAREAVTYLGLGTLSSLVLTLDVFQRVPAAVQARFDMESLWAHALHVGRAAKTIALAESAGRRVADEAFAAGMLHGTGTLILVMNFPEEYQKCLTDGAAPGSAAMADREQERFGVSHGEVGAYLIGLWGLPGAVIEAIAWHHHPLRSTDQSFTPLTAVHAACSLACSPASAVPTGETGRADPTWPELDLDYLARIGCRHRPAAWLSAVRTEADARHSADGLNPPAAPDAAEAA